MNHKFRWTSTVDLADTSQRKMKGCLVKSELLSLLVTLIEFLFLLCMGHFKSTKLCLASNRNSLRCDYVCENKDDVWVHKRVSFLSKDFSDQRSQIGQKICSNLQFLNKIFLSGSHPSGEAC